MLHSTMIVDDSEADRYIARWSIAQNNLSKHILEARDGKEALEILQKKREEKDQEKDKNENKDKEAPHLNLILLDIHMPRMNGQEFLAQFAQVRELRKDLFKTKVVLMISSSDLLQEKMRRMKYDFVCDFISKPLTPGKVDLMIQKCFST